MTEERYQEIERKVAALEEKVQEQQKIIEELKSNNIKSEIKLTHPSINNGTMLC
ncbi:MAG: hypothetical protein ACRC7N_03580 [Clostridium sp.]